MLDDVLQTLDQRRHQSLASLKQLLAIPSISAQSGHADDIRRCALWLQQQLRFAAMEASVMETGGHPIVVAKNKHLSGRPTVLFYGHYDVQPPEPLEQWHTPPFEPTERDGKLYARGAADDKGQFWCHIEALTAWQAHGGVPVNVTVLIEGEEEVGSHNLDAFVQKHRDDLKCDIAVVSDTGQFARGTPAITYGLRGLLYCEVFITGACGDLHSGIHGGAAPNAANALVKLLGSLHDEHGRVTVPGFYDDVVPLADEERAAWKKLPFDEADYAASLGVDASPGEAGYSVLERRWGRPTCDVNGITAGYQGEGAKTIIPSQASAKVSFRLVPGQDPQKIRASFEQAMRDRLLPGCTIAFRYHGASRAVLVPQNSNAMRLAAEAVEQGFGTPPALIREGGSIPIVEMFKRELKVDTLLIGFGLPDDNLHAPNEKFDLDAFYAGQRTAAVLYERLAKLPTKSLAIA